MSFCPYSNLSAEQITQPNIRKQMARALKVKKVSPDDECTVAAARILRTRLKEFYSHWRGPDPNTDSGPASRFADFRQATPLQRRLVEDALS